MKTWRANHGFKNSIAMAKKKMNPLIYAAAYGAIAFFGYRAWSKNRANKAETAREKGNDAINDIKQRQAEAEAAQKMENERKSAESAANSIQNPQSFAAKVAEIQSLLGVNIDGKPGPVTHAAYQRRFGLDRGNITPMTVSYYLDRAKRDKFFI